MKRRSALMTERRTYFAIAQVKVFALLLSPLPLMTQPILRAR